jgi:exosortase
MSSPAAVLDKPLGDSRKASPGLAIGVAALVLAAHAPLLFLHFQQLWLKPHYQLFPLVLAGAFALLWPLKAFAWDPPGTLRLALRALALGVGLIVAGALVESWAIAAVSPTLLVGAGGVAMFAAVALAVFAGPGLYVTGRRNPGGGMTLAIVSWVMLALAVFFNSPAGSMLSGLVATAALAVTLGGWPSLRRCLPALLYLLLIVPPPFGLDTKLVQSLQVIASRTSSEMLDFLSVYHNLAGVTIHVGKQPYEVENACSGISSLLSTLAIVLFYVLWYRVHWLRASVLTLSAFFWVLVNNILRIVGMVFFDVGFTVFGRHIQLNMKPDGLLHYPFGIFLFALTLFLLWSTDRFLMFLGRSDVPKRRLEPLELTPQARESRLDAALALAGAWYRSIPVAALFAVLLAVQLAENYALASRVPYSGSALSKLYEDIKLDLLPERVGDWKRPAELREEKRPPGNPLGEFSRIWTYKTDRNIQCLLSLDYPYPEFHDLRVCYVNNGWQIDKDDKGEDKTVSWVHKPESGPELYCVRVPMKRPVERHATLWFCEFDQDGVGVDPLELGELKARNVGERISQRLSFMTNRWKRLVAPSATAASTGLGSVLQVQLLIETYQPLPDYARDQLQELFVQSADRLRAKCVELKSKK